MAGQNETETKKEKTEDSDAPPWRELEENIKPEKRIHGRVIGRMVPVGPDGVFLKDDYR